MSCCWGQVTSLHFIDEETLAAVGGDDKNAFLVWDLSTGQSIFKGSAGGTPVYTLRSIHGWADSGGCEGWSASGVPSASVVPCLSCARRDLASSILRSESRVALRCLRLYTGDVWSGISRALRKGDIARFAQSDSAHSVFLKLHVCRECVHTVVTAFEWKDYGSYYRC